MPKGIGENANTAIRVEAPVVSTHKLVNSLHLGLLFNRFCWTWRLRNFLLTNAIAIDYQQRELLKYLFQMEMMTTTKRSVYRVVEEHTKVITESHGNDRLAEALNEYKKQFSSACKHEDPCDAQKHEIYGHLVDAFDFRLKAESKIRDVLARPLGGIEKQLANAHRVAFELGLMLDQCVRPEFDQTWMVKIMAYFSEHYEDLKPSNVKNPNLSKQQRDNNWNKWLKTWAEFETGLVKDLSTFLSRELHESNFPTLIAIDRIDALLTELGIRFKISKFSGGFVTRGNQLRSCLVKLEPILSEAFPHLLIKPRSVSRVKKSGGSRTVERDKALFEYVLQRRKEPKDKRPPLEAIRKEFNVKYQDRGWNFANVAYLHKKLNDYAKSAGRQNEVAIYYRDPEPEQGFA